MKARRRPTTARVTAPTRSEEAQPARPYHIYELVEIIDQGSKHTPLEIIFYVGMTNDPKGRYLQHAAGDENEEKTKIFRHAQAHPDTITIEMRILDSTLDVEKAKRLEAYWIVYRTLEGRNSLTNTSAGVCFSLYEIDEAHYERLGRMLHKEFGCYASDEHPIKQYAAPVYVARAAAKEEKPFWTQDFGKFFRDVFG